MEEKEATISMQLKAWTYILFKEWIRHFIKNVKGNYNRSVRCKHLFILDGYFSHVILDVVKITMKSGIHLLTFSSHPLHALQHLDMTCFKPFKVAFRAYRDRWTLSHVGQVLGKDDIAIWRS